MNSIEKKIAEKNATFSKIYGDIVNQKIRERYSLSEELSILRQRDEKPSEYAEYNAYVERCKAEAKKQI